MTSASKKNEKAKSTGSAARAGPPDPQDVAFEIVKRETPARAAAKSPPAAPAAKPDRAPAEKGPAETGIARKRGFFGRFFGGADKTGLSTDEIAALGALPPVGPGTLSDAPPDAVSRTAEAVPRSRVARPSSPPAAKETPESPPPEHPAPAAAPKTVAAASGSATKPGDAPTRPAPAAPPIPKKRLLGRLFHGTEKPTLSGEEIAVLDSLPPIGPGSRSDPSTTAELPRTPSIASQATVSLPALTPEVASKPISGGTNGSTKHEGAPQKDALAATEAAKSPEPAAPAALKTDGLAAAASRSRPQSAPPLAEVRLGPAPSSSEKKDSNTLSSTKNAGADPRSATPTTHNMPSPLLSTEEPGEKRRRNFLSTFLPRTPDKRPLEYEPESVTPHPPAGVGEKIVDLRPIRPPYSYVRVIYEEELGRYRYEVLEPQLTPEEAEAFQFVRDAFIRTLDVDMTRLDREGARQYLIEQYEALANRHHLRLSDISRARVGYFLEREFLGFGMIDAMMTDPNIEDISCDGPNIPLFIYHRKFESIRTNMSFASDDELDAFVMQTVQRSGKHISVAEPLVDATLPDGSRLQASLSREVTTRGSTFTIRKFRQDPFTPTDLVVFETASPDMMAFLWLAVERGASALICGGTASGKTTTLNAMSVFIPPSKKIVSIEDTREINLQHENWIPGVTRAGGVVEESGDGHRTGEVDMYDLLRAAVRQRPDYILLGEVRGREAYVLFQAMATGHTVFSTLHADSVASAVHRLESKPIEIPRNMLAGLDLFIIQGETKVGNRRVRKIREITELTGIDPRTGEILTNRVYAWEPSTSEFRYTGSSLTLRRAAEEQNVTESAIRHELERRILVLNTLRERGIRDITRVSRVVTAYAIDPERALRMLTGMGATGAPAVAPANAPAVSATPEAPKAGGEHGSP